MVIPFDALVNETTLDAEVDGQTRDDEDTGYAIIVGLSTTGVG